MNQINNQPLRRKVYSRYNKTIKLSESISRIAIKGPWVTINPAQKEVVKQFLSYAKE